MTSFRRFAARISISKPQSATTAQIPHVAISRDIPGREAEEMSPLFKARVLPAAITF